MEFKGDFENNEWQCIFSSDALSSDDSPVFSKDNCVVMCFLSKSEKHRGWRWGEARMRGSFGEERGEEGRAGGWIGRSGRDAWENKFLSSPDFGSAQKPALMHFRANIKCINTSASGARGKYCANIQIFGLARQYLRRSIALLKKGEFKFHARPCTTIYCPASHSCYGKIFLEKYSNILRFHALLHITFHIKYWGRK